MELCKAVGEACLEMPASKVHRLLQAGRLGEWGVVDMPHTTVSHFGTLERRRVRLVALEAMRPKGEAVDVRSNRLASRVLDLAENRLDQWQDSDRFSPRDLVDVADLLGKLARVSTGKPAGPNGTEPQAPVDPLTSALLGSERPSG